LIGFSLLSYEHSTNLEYWRTYRTKLEVHT